MFSHMTIGSNDIDRSRKFYDALFGSVGGKPGSTDEKGRLIYMHNGGMLLITKPVNGQPANGGNGVTLGLAMNSPEQARTLHDAAVAAGGTTCEDPPGKRESGMGPLYLAYFRDPDGNKFCALHKIG